MSTPVSAETYYGKILPICPRCKRKAVGWPTKRPDVCSPVDWVHCIRNLEERKRS